MRLKTVFLVVAMFFASLRLIAGNETATVNFLKGYDGKYDNCLYMKVSGFMLKVAKLAAGKGPEREALDGVKAIHTLLVSNGSIVKKEKGSANLLVLQDAMDKVLGFIDAEKFSGIVVDSMYMVERPVSKAGAEDGVVMMVMKDNEDGGNLVIMAMVGEVSLGNIFKMAGEDLADSRKEIVEKYGESSEQVKAFDRIISGDNADIHSVIVNLDRMMDE